MCSMTANSAERGFWSGYLSLVLAVDHLLRSIDDPLDLSRSRTYSVSHSRLRVEQLCSDTDLDQAPAAFFSAAEADSHVLLAPLRSCRLVLGRGRRRSARRPRIRLAMLARGHRSAACSLTCRHRPCIEWRASLAPRTAPANSIRQTARHQLIICSAAAASRRKNTSEQRTEWRRRRHIYRRGQRNLHGWQ